MKQRNSKDNDSEQKNISNIIIVEDDIRLRNYAIETLSNEADIKIVGTAGSLSDGVGLIEKKPDLALLDLGLPDGSGVELINLIRKENPDCKILVFTVFEDKASVINTLKAGADGYILKDTSAEVLIANVRSTLLGETPISARAANHLLSLVRDEPTNQIDEANAPHLSPREREILEYLARGLSRKEAARVMNLSPHTVAEYVQSIYRKLQVKSRGEAVFEAIQSKIISLTSK